MEARKLTEEILLEMGLTKDHYHPDGYRKGNTVLLFREGVIEYALEGRSYMK